MSGLYTRDKVLLIANSFGSMDVDSYKHELECVLTVINSGRLGLGVDPKSCAWGSDAHAIAVKKVIEHAQAVANAIAYQQIVESEATEVGSTKT